MTANTDLLLRAGDSYEREGCHNYRLGEKFPEYAEFWATYVHPYRDPADGSKLRPDFPIDLEMLVNAHYSVWYHFTVAYRQIAFLLHHPSELGDPLFHLASSIDMAERTLALALIVDAQLRGKKPIKELTPEKFDECVGRFWECDYEDKFKTFASRYKPVNITVHRLWDIIKSLIPYKHTAALNKFETAANKVRHYRNDVTHNPFPIQVVIGGIVHIPKEEHLSKYSDARWSSGRSKVNVDHFGSAEAVLADLANKLIERTDELWNVVLEKMAGIVSSASYEDYFHPSERGLRVLESDRVSLTKLGTNAQGPILYSGLQWINHPSGLSVQSPSDGTVVCRPPSISTPADYSD